MRLTGLLALWMGLSACSPVFNWRDAAVTDGELTALMPCKPKRAERDVVLGSDPVRVQLLGCDADGATFAVTSARAADMPQAELWLTAWRTSTRLQWEAAHSGTLNEAPVAMARAVSHPAAWELQAQGVDKAGQKQALHMRWFAHRQRDGSLGVYQAAVLGMPGEAEASSAATAFFDGLQLP